MKKYIVLVVLLIILAIFSNTTYEQQTLIPLLQQLLSTQPFYQFLSLFEFTYWGNTVSIETRGYYHFVEFLIRKAAHFSFFGLIGVVIYYLLRQKSMAPLWAIGAVFTLGCLDEFRQSFSAGRTATMQDVLLDTTGAFVFVSISWVFYKQRKLLRFSKIKT